MIILLLMALGAFLVMAIIIIVKIFFQPKRVKTISQLYKHGKYAQAIRLSKHILSKDNRDASAHYFLGLCYEAEGKAELALMELKTVNQLGKFDEYVKEQAFRKKIAQLYMKFNQSEEALKEYLLLVKMDETNAEYYFLIGSLFEKRGRGDAAVNYYKKAISFNERHPAGYAALGSLLYRTKRLGDAKVYLDKATTLDPNNIVGSYYLGKALQDSNEYSAALKAFDKASKDPEFKVKALAERGACYISLGDSDRAFVELFRAVRLNLDPTAQEALYARYLLAYLYEQERKIEEAIEQWEEIHKIRQNFRDVAEKLTNYQGLRSDDIIKDFLIAGQNKFFDMCKKATSALGFEVLKIFPVAGGCQVSASETADKKWKNQKSQPRLIAFMRVTDPIEEDTVRSFNDSLRKQNFPRGIMLTSSYFSKMGQLYAESRPIELYDKDQLQKILKNALKS